MYNLVNRVKTAKKNVHYQINQPFQIEIFTTMAIMELNHNRVTIQSFFLYKIIF